MKTLRDMVSPGRYGSLHVPDDVKAVLDLLRVHVDLAAAIGAPGPWVDIYARRHGPCLLSMVPQRTRGETMRKLVEWVRAGCVPEEDDN